MKTSDIEKRLRDEARSHTPPDVYDNVISAAEKENLFRTEDRSPKPLNKRFYFRVAALVACAAVCVSVVLPLTLGSEDPIVEPVASKTLTVNDVYGMGAVTSVNLLSERLSLPVGGNVMQTVRASVSTESAEAELMDQLEKFNEYFNAFDCFLGDNVISTVATENTDEGVYGDFEIKLTVTVKDLFGNDDVHVMYYTETLVRADNSGKDTKERYVLNGYMLVNGADFILQGEREYESDGKETQSELKIRAFSADNENTYVEMKQESSEEEGESECKYVYDLYVDHELVEETEVRFETEKKGDKEETSYEMEFRSGDDRGKFKVEKQIKESVAEIRVEYELDVDHGEFWIKRTDDGKNEYQFSDGTVKVYRSY